VLDIQFGQGLGSFWDRIGYSEEGEHVVKDSARGFE
jgi:hypothetical protein